MKGNFKMSNGKTTVTVPKSQVANLETKGYKQVKEGAKASTKPKSSADK